MVFWKKQHEVLTAEPSLHKGTCEFIYSHPLVTLREYTSRVTQPLSTWSHEFHQDTSELSQSFDLRHKTWLSLSSRYLQSLPPCLAPRTEFSVQNAQETATVKFCPPYHHYLLRVYIVRSHHLYLVSSHVCLDVKFVLYWALFGGIISSSVWRITGHNQVSCFTCRYWIFYWTISSLFPFRLCHLQSHLKLRRHCLTVMLSNRSCSVV